MGGSCKAEWPLASMLERPPVDSVSASAPSRRLVVHRTKGPIMDNAVLFVAVYDDEDSAMFDLDEIKLLHEDDMIGDFDAAVIEKRDGKPHIQKRVDRPRINIIPELLGRGKLRHGELHKAAEELTEGQAALVVVGEPTLDKAFDNAVKRAAKVSKESFDQTTDELARALTEASKS
jgi:uncharacterized membrane protein